MTSFWKYGWDAIRTLLILLVCLFIYGLILSIFRLDWIAIALSLLFIVVIVGLYALITFYLIRRKRRWF